MSSMELAPSIAIGFPGQGAHDHEKMKALVRQHPAALDILIESEDILRRPVLGLLTKELPIEATTREDQIRLYVGEVALWKAAQDEGIIPENGGQFFYGSSAGELAALHAAGAYDFRTGLELIDTRGTEMHKASIINPGEMLVASGLPFDEAMNLVKDFPGVYAVNDNPGLQTVFSGSKEAIERVIQHLSSFNPNVLLHRPGIKGPAHTPFMAPAKEGLRNAAKKARISRPQHTFMSNQAKLLKTGAQIRSHLVAQLTRGVRLTESAHQLYYEHDVRTFYDVGLVKILSGLMRREFKKNVEVIAVVDALLPKQPD